LDTIDSEISDKKPCIQCGTLIALNGRFCNNCGARQSGEISSSENKWGLLKQAGLFFAIDIIACVLAKFAGVFDTFSWALFFDLLMAVSAIVFFAINWAENKSLLIWRNFSWQKLAAYAAIAISAQCVVHYSVGWLNIVIYSRDEHYFQLLKGNLFAEFLVIFFTAVMPALFEELGYRGYLLQTLLKVADREQAVYISAFLFAIIHMSFISLFWLIPFALFLGFVRLKEETLWYGILIHFCFNLTACLFDFL
jgi:membrane protease YdiL (CAAX protease family)